MQTRQRVYGAKVKESPFLHFTSVNTNQPLLNMLERRCVHWLGRRGGMWLAQVQNPVLTSRVDFFPVVSDSTLPCFVNSPTGCLLPVRILDHVSVKFELFLSGY